MPPPLSLLAVLLAGAAASSSAAAPAGAAAVPPPPKPPCPLATAKPAAVAVRGYGTSADGCIGAQGHDTKRQLAMSVGCGAGGLNVSAAAAVVSKLCDATPGCAAFSIISPAYSGCKKSGALQCEIHPETIAQSSQANQWWSVWQKTSPLKPGAWPYAPGAAGPPSPPPPPPGRCSSDLDCQLNGRCTGGTCHCDRAWSGAPDCSRLKLLPAKGRGEAYSKLGGENTGWDGTSIYDPISKRWQLFVGESLNCGINSWRNGNGRCIRATSLDPQGPYVLAEVIQDGFCCCTQVARIPPTPSAAGKQQQANATWVMSHMGDGTCKHSILNCVGGITPKNATIGVGNCSRSPRPSVGIRAALSASSPHGPWAAWQPVGGAGSPPLVGSNDNGLRALPNGTLFIWRSASPKRVLSDGSSTPNPLPAGAPNNCRVIELSRAENASMPFIRYSGTLTASSWCSVEAPEFWVDSRGYYHSIWEVNGKDGAAAPGPCKHCNPPRPGGTPQVLPGNTTTAGQHMYSVNGYEWHVSPVIAWSAVVEFTDGTSLSFARREDPKLMFDSCDQIIGVTCPVQLSNTSDHSYVLMQPVAHDACTPEKVVWS